MDHHCCARETPKTVLVYPCVRDAQRRRGTAEIASVATITYPFARRSRR